MLRIIDEDIGGWKAQGERVGWLVGCLRERRRGREVPGEVLSSAALSTIVESANVLPIGQYPFQSTCFGKMCFTV
jgi:hypothetical protein